MSRCMLHKAATARRSFVHVMTQQNCSYKFLMKSHFISNSTSEVKIVCLIEMSSCCNVAVSKGEGVMHNGWSTIENGP